MAPVKGRKTLPDSERKMLPDAKASGKCDPGQRIEITIMVRPRSGTRRAAAHAAAAELMAAKLPEERTYLTRDEFADQRGADPADFDLIGQFAHDHDLTVTESSIPQRLIKLSGTLAALCKAFGAKVANYRVGKTSFRGRTGTLSVPTQLADVIVGVYGFDTRQVARPHYRLLGAVGGASVSEAGNRKMPRPAGAARAKKNSKVTLPEKAAATSSLKPFTAPQVAKLYNFPAGLDGTGQCIALIELNTPNAHNKMGTGYTTADLKTYFKKLGLTAPQVTAVGVDGGANLPNINLDADGEVMLDIEVAGAIAPGAKVAVYFGPNTNKGFIDVISAAVHDNVRKPSVVSISWGGPEDLPYTTAQQRNGIDQVLQDAAALGVTVCCASGDDGSADLPLADDQGNPLRDGKPHVDFPSSSAFALACGGTTLVGAGTTITSEVVWNEGDATSPNQPSGAGGGGVSNFFAKPGYQAAATVPKSPVGKVGRGVPDVAGNADSATGYLCKIAGIAKLVPIGGTSAVAPLWAGLVALINQRLATLGKKPAGFINAVLYANAGAFQDTTSGNNDIDNSLHKYAATSGWDPASGLGSPDGTKVMKALGG